MEKGADRMVEESILKLMYYKVVTGIIRCETGLHIGGSAETIEIGGMDNPIIKDPITKLPYIPGSSIKGKMRSLLEWELGNFEKDGEVHKWCGDLDCPICRIFGTTADEAKIGPSRLVVRDALVEGSVHCPIGEKCPYKREREPYRLCESVPECSYGKLERLRQKTGLMYAEEKWENTINRLTARANPRQMERVPSGICFEFELVYRVFDFKDGKVTDEKLFEYVTKGMKLLEKDAVGGSGSRGYGKIRFENLKVGEELLSLDTIES